MSLSLGGFPHALVALEENRIIVYCDLASLVIWLYDYLLTIGLEINLVWPTPNSLGKLLFFGTRYLALLDMPMLIYVRVAPQTTSPDACILLLRLSGTLIIFGMYLSELVFVFRTWAIWGRNSKLAIGLLVLITILAIPCGVSAYFSIRRAEFGPSPYPRLMSCWTIQTTGPIIFISYLIFVGFELLLLVLTVYKGIQHYEIVRESGSKLVVTLYRDGVIFYIYLIGLSFVNIVVILIGRNPAPSLIIMQRALHSILTARVLLDLREAASLDRLKEVPTSEMDTTIEERGEPSSRTALSSVIIGVDSWFRDIGTSTQV